MQTIYFQVSEWIPGSRLTSLNLVGRPTGICTWYSSANLYSRLDPYTGRSDYCTVPARRFIFMDMANIRYLRLTALPNTAVGLLRVYTCPACLYITCDVSGKSENFWTALFCPDNVPGFCWGVKVFVRMHEKSIKKSKIYSPLRTIRVASTPQTSQIAVSNVNTVQFILQLEAYLRRRNDYSCLLCSRIDDLYGRRNTDPLVSPWSSGLRWSLYR